MSTIINAVKDGRFDAADTWDLRVPVLGDIARCGNYLVSFHTNITCDEIQANGTGRYTTNVPNLVITAIFKNTAPTAVTGFTVSALSGKLTLNGDVYGGNVANGIGILLPSAGGTIEINGSVHAGGAPGAFATSNTSLYPITINNGNIINNAYASAVAGYVIYNPGPSNYIQYPKTGGGFNNFPLQLPATEIKKFTISGEITGEFMQGGGHVIGSAIIKAVD
jgi:hypothetical protein